MQQGIATTTVHVWSCIVWQVYDSDGVRAVPINEASVELEADGTAKWFKEVKPMNTDVLVGLAILLHVAYLCHEEVYMLTDDAKNFFNQCTLSKPDRWQNVTYMYDYKHDVMVLVA